MTKVTISNLTKTFGNVVAVKDLNLEVKDGEFLVLVGPNGCGKTTLLRLISGVIIPDKGSIYFDDVLVNDIRPEQRGVRVVFQGYALYPNMKVYDDKRYSNLNFALKVRKYTLDKSRYIINSVNLRIGVKKTLFDRKPNELSQGEKQKVAVARAITLPPKVFLMDEPVSNLDPSSRIRVIKELLRLHEGLKTTTIYVTHNLAEAMAIADRVAVMNEGTIQQVGTPDEVHNNPVNGFVVDFIKYFDYSSLLHELSKK